MKREIRQFRAEDAANVAQMWNESDSAWPGGFTGGVPFTAERVLRDQSRARNLATLIAFADGKAVGYCSVMRFREDPRVAYVGLLSAHPAYHGQGFGRDLLKAALALAVEQGFVRLDLHTWAGNMKAVPLYKKTGFFWVPGTAVHMVNYLPTILRLDVARDFFGTDLPAEADWYSCFRRDLAVRPDEWVEGGMRVYPYEFARDGRRLRVLIDPEAHAVTAVETDAFAVACRFAGERAPAGVPARLRWDVTNSRPEQGPLPMVLLARGEDGLPVDLRRTLQIESSQTVMATVTPERDVAVRRPSDAAHSVRTTVVLGDRVVELATGLRVCHPVDVVAPGRCLYLTPGVPRRVSLLLHSNLDRPARVAVRLAGPPELRLEPATGTVELPAGGNAGLTATATATAEGAFALAAHLNVEAAGVTIQPKPQSIPVHSVGPGGVVGSADEERAYLTTAQLRVVARRRGAGVEVRDADGESVADCGSTLGPPFGPSELDSTDFAVALEREGNALTAVLSAPSPLHPGVTYQRRIELAPGPAVRLGHRVINGGDEEHAPQVVVRMGGGPQPARFAAPLTEGLVVEENVAFPDWRDPALLAPESYQESWIALAGKGRVAGFVWQRAASVEGLHWGGLGLTLDFGKVPPSGVADAPALWLYGGPGDWQAVRRFWRQMVAPDAPERQPTPEPALTARLAPPVLVGDTAELELRSLRSRALTGRGALEFPDGPRCEPAELEVADWRRGSPVRQPIRVTWPTPDAPGAWAGRLRAKLDIWNLDFPLTLVRGGDAAVPVRVREETRDGRRVVVVENGWLTFAVAPDFAGALIELSDGRASHLLSAFPCERPFQDLNPWFGGITPLAQPAGAWGASQPMAAREYRWEETARDGLLGQRWAGVALTAEPDHKDLRGCSFRVEYLTLGRSNLVAVITRLDTAGAPLPAAHGVAAFLASGDAHGVTLHFERGGLWAHRASRGLYAPAERWAAAEYPGTGDAVAIVSGTPGWFFVSRDTGYLSVGNLVTPENSGAVAPGESVTYLALARGLSEARLYQAFARG